MVRESWRNSCYRNVLIDWLFDKSKKRVWFCYKVYFDLVYLFNGIPTHYGLSNKKNWIQWLGCSLMDREIWAQSQVESYQRLKKWYLILPCLTLSIIRYGSRIKWSNPGEGVMLTPTPSCSSYWKGSLRVTIDCGHQLYFMNFWWK